MVCGGLWEMDGLGRLGRRFTHTMLALGKLELGKGTVRTGFTVDTLLIKEA
jgi:hypothetical protein